jgi:GNAT superfamily N-acetyltransferase
MTWYTIKPDQRTAKGSVLHIWTDPDYRRQGIASRLWEYAQSLDGVTKPRHSRDRTRDGKAWVASLSRP